MKKREFMAESERRGLGLEINFIPHTQLLN